MKRIDLLTAAVLAAGSIGLAASPAVFAQDAGTQQPAAAQPAQPSGGAAPAGQQPGAAAQPADQSAASAAQPAAGQQGASQQASESDIRQSLAQTAQAAVTKGVA